MKVTRATLKSFIRKNAGKLYIWRRRAFDSMVDGCTSTAETGFSPALSSDRHPEHTYGIAGVWMVGGGRDYITPYSGNGFSGFEVYNSCGSFYLAVKN